MKRKLLLMQFYSQCVVILLSGHKCMGFLATGFSPCSSKRDFATTQFHQKLGCTEKTCISFAFFLYFLKNTMIGMIVAFNNQLNQTSLKNLNPCLERLEIFSFVQALHLLEQSEQKDETFHCTSSKIQFE